MKPKSPNLSLKLYPQKSRISQALFLTAEILSITVSICVEFCGLMGTETKKTASTNKPNNNNNKKRQRYLPHNRAVKKKGAYPLRPGVQGFFITCDGGKERQASHEAMDVIDSFYEELLNGVEKIVRQAGLASKPMNKKIKFESSDSDDSGSEDNNDGKDADTDRKDEECVHKSDNGDKGSNNNEESVMSADAQPNISSEKHISEGEGNKEEGTKNEENKGLEPEPNISSEKQISEGEGNKEEGTKNEENKKLEPEEPTEPLPKKQCLDTVAPISKNSGNDNVEKESVDKLIEAELAELGDRNKRRFSSLDTGCNGVAFVQMRKRQGDPSPKSIVQHMMTSLASSKKHVSRFLLRVLPVEVSCYASDEEISRAIKPLVEQFFPVEAQNPLKFSVIYDARANTGIDRMKIIDAVARSVPLPHKVDLNNPDINIVVQIVRTVCLIGVVEKYKELSKYNIRQLTSKK
ncbi:hypothetical protein Leryth_023457 [Lithospermum erythrorhizon]|nr:hypothetical protein Leryth_023457 [Lithospermum erythrorhizon]